MNKAKLIKNRLTVIWSGVTKIAPHSFEELFCTNGNKEKIRK